MHRLLRSGKSWSGHELNCAFLNLPGGSFADISGLSGLQFADDARGVCAIDWDGDGDLDLWLRNRTGPQLRFMHNTYAGPNRSVAVRLVGRTCNRDAIGARVTARVSGRTVMRVVSADASFQTQSSKWVHFGLEPGEAVDRLEVRWPGGGESVFGQLSPGRYVIEQGVEEAVALPPATPVKLRPKPMPTEQAEETSEVSLAFRLPLPNMGGTDFDGARLAIGSHRGSPLLVNLWASWCPGCLAELGAFTDQQTLLEGAGVQIMALSLDKPEDRSSARRIVEKLSPWFSTGMADADWLAVLEVVQRIVIDVQDQMNLPASILIDHEGRIAKLYSGPVDPLRLAEDVRNLARTDEDIIRQASPYAKGLGHVTIPHSKAIRLLQMSEALITNGHPILAQYFADALVEQLARYATLAGTQKRAGRVFVELARVFDASDPTRAAACAKRGDAFFVLASRRYAADMAANPADDRAWFGFGECLDSITDAKLADEVVREALDAIPQPGSPADLRERGKEVFNLRRWAEAIPYLEQALRANPDDANSQYRLGTALMRSGRAAEGIPHVEHALSVLPPHAVAEFNFAGALRNAGDRIRAIKHYRKTLELDPTYEPARQALRELYSGGAGG